MTERDQLAARFRRMEARGLLDARFDLAGRGPLEAVCGEVNALYRAVEAGHQSVLDFNDSRR